MSRRAILAVIALAPLAAACTTTSGTPEPIITTHDVGVAVPTKCKPEIGPEPDYPDTDEALAAASDIFEGVKLLKAGRKLRIARDGVKSAALQACEGVAPNS